MGENKNAGQFPDEQDRDYELCPACGGAIDLDEIDVNNNTEDGYGDMIVPYDCPHCRTELRVIFDAQNGYDFKRIEAA